MERVALVLLWLLRHGIALVCFGGTLAFAVAAGKHYTGLTISGWLLAFVTVVVAVAAHEGGHYLAARWQRMHVLLVDILGWELHPQRRGMRVRRRRRRVRGLGGYVMAFPRQDRPERPQMIALVLGGPLANLLLGVIAGAAAWATQLKPGTEWIAAFAAANVGMGLFNLVPWRHGHVTDGALLLDLLRRTEVSAALRAHIRLIALSMESITADQLPEHDITVLERESGINALIALWYRLKAAQNRGDWAAASSQASTFDTMHSGLPHEAATVLAEMLALMQVELAFSRAMHAGDPAPLAAHLWQARTLWATPWLLPRCQALLAALEGDLPRRDAALDRAARFADVANDASLPRSEALLRDAIRAITPYRADAIAA